MTRVAKTVGPGAEPPCSSRGGDRLRRIPGYAYLSGPASRSAQPPKRWPERQRTGVQALPEPQLHLLLHIVLLCKTQ